MDDNLKKILFVSSEVYPFAKTGGLADVSCSLPKVLSKIGYEIAISLPLYETFPSGFSLKKIREVRVFVGEKMESGFMYESSLGAIPVFLIAQKDYFDREYLYGDENGDYPDNAERFSFFCRGILSGIKDIGWKPQIIHCNDWQTALIPLYLKNFYSKDDSFKETGTLFTIHNLAYQGVFSKEKLKFIGLGEEFFTMDKLEFYGKINIMKSGLIFSDLLNTVSPTYSREIQTPEFGMGLDGVLRERSRELYGILNGIDYEVWDPSRDRELVKNYSTENLQGKKENKKFLQRESSLPQDNLPVIGFVSRLTQQKGIDLIAESIDVLSKLPLQFVLLGKGEKRYEEILIKMAKKYSQKIKVYIGFDPLLAKRIYTGADFFLMPSLYEPCGLGQMISLRYGTIPIVRKTGGLADTVEEFDSFTEKGNGFLFEKYSSSHMIEAIKRAIKLYENKDKWEKLIKNAMKQDFSWDKSAKEYIKLYRGIQEKTRNQP